MMRWTEQEHRLLQDMAAAGVGAPVIANRLGRTMQAVSRQAYLRRIPLTWQGAKPGCRRGGAAHFRWNAVGEKTGGQGKGLQPGRPATGGS